MADEKRMTAEREAEIRKAADENDPAWSFKHRVELLRELDAVRAELAELVAALPRCSYPECQAAATKPSGSQFDPDVYCDKHGGSIYDLPQAVVLRRLAERSKR